ncbi:MAG: TetR/AcrR family transcriptional regulator [Deltaproteobacteria bacterium]|nr:TetR/AcrR family transcriptional regulator [Deltaproteobacteria bacterium]
MAYLRKTPRQARAQATFDAIVEAAARILNEPGPARLTTNGIAARAGVSVGSLYQYFPNRQAIVRALLERELARAEAMRPALLDDASQPPLRRLRAAVDWHFDVHAARPALAHALQRLAAAHLPAAELHRLDRLRAARTARFIETLGVGTAVDRDAAAFVVATCLAALTEATTTRRPAALRSASLRAEVVAMLSRYLLG